MKNILIESESAYLFCRKNLYPNEDIIWHTSSPWLLQKLQTSNETVISLEKEITLNSQKEIGKVSTNIGSLISKEIDKLCTLNNINYQLGMALEHRLQITIFTFLYKSKLLRKWISNYQSFGNLFVVGNTNLKKIDGFDIMVGRFDNIFASLVNFSNISNVEIIPFQDDSGKKIISQIERVDNVSLCEKTLYILNNYSLLQFSKIVIKKVFHLDISLPRNSYRNDSTQTLSIIKKCPLVEESITHLKKFGMKIEMDGRFLDSIPNRSMKLPFEISCLENIFNNAVNHLSVASDELIKSSFDIVCLRTYNALGFGFDFVQNKNIFNKFSSCKSDSISVLTNGLAAPRERLLQQIFTKKNVKIFSCEHGVTAGICHKMTECYFSRGLYTNGQDYKICYSEKSLKVIGKKKTIDGLDSGAPLINKNIKYRNLQKLIIKNCLKLPRKGRVILYLGLLTRNNMLIPPFTITDLEYFQITKTILFKVFSRISDQCILKLYPSNRYKDPDFVYNYSDIAKNIKILQYFEFTELRAVADVIILSNPQSTFGWALSTKKPIIFVELEAAPIEKNIFPLFDKALFVIDGKKSGWYKEVLRLINLPSHKLLELWNEKNKYQVELEKIIFGDKPNDHSPGKEIASYIFKKI